VRLLYGLPVFSWFDVELDTDALDDVDRATINRLLTSGDAQAFAMWFDDNETRLREHVIISFKHTGATSEALKDAQRPLLMVCPDARPAGKMYTSPGTR